MRRLSKLPWPLLVPFLILCGMVALLRLTHAEKGKPDPTLGEGPQLSTLTEGQRYLLQAVESSDWRIAAELLREGEDPNLRRPILSPHNGKPDSDPRKRYQGDPLLKIAVVAREESIVRLLLDNGADVNAPGRFGYTALMVAADINEPKLVKLLLERGADPNVTGTPRQESALHIVVARPNNVGVGFSFFIPPNSPTTMVEARKAMEQVRKERAQKMAATSQRSRQRQITILKLLLTAGADPNQKDSNGQTPTDYARKQDDKELVRLLTTTKFVRKTALTKGAGR